jgi:hypothetical protein
MDNAMKMIRALIPRNRLTDPLLRAVRVSLGMVSDAMPASYYLSMIEGRPVSTRRGRMVVCAAMPKSGSTFVTRKLAEYFNCTHTNFAVGRGCGETEVSPHRILDLLQENVVIHQHVLGTEGNANYIFKYADTVVFQTRNIYETLLSFRRHLLGDSLDWPFMNFTPSFRTLSPERQLNQIIDLVAPWILNFYVSWEGHLRNPPPGKKLLHLDYREVAASETEALGRIIREVEGSCNEERLRTILDQKIGKYRMKENDWITPVDFTEDQRDRVRILASYFAETDFSPIGIPISKFQ